MQWPQPETCAGQPGMPHMLLARQQSLHMSPRTNWVLPPMRSRLHVLPRWKARAQGGSSADGSETSSRRRFANSYLTTSGCGTTFAGWCSTAESASGHSSLLGERCSCSCRYVEQPGRDGDPNSSSCHQRVRESRAEITATSVSFLVQIHQRPLEKRVQALFPAGVQGVSPGISLFQGVGWFCTRSLM